MVISKKLTRPQLVKRLYRIARDVRVWAEQQARATFRDSESLRGVCAIAACELFERISVEAFARQHPPTFAKSEFHAFVLVDGMVVDVAATQFFNTDPINGVWIVDLNDEPEPGVWAATEFATTLQEILALTCWSRWPACELPLPLQRKRAECAESAPSPSKDHQVCRYTWQDLVPRHQGLNRN